MKRTKLLLSVLLATIFLAAQVIVVGAAPAAQDTSPITGTIESIVLETDTETDTTTVVVTLSDEFGETQTVRLSVEDATVLGLVTDDGSGPMADENKVGTDVEIDPALVIPDEPMPVDGMDEPQHPVGSALSDFFSELLGVDYEVIMEYHDNGVGFGVIAQALWMTNSLDGDSEIFAAILDAKQNKDFSGIELPDGSTPTNWGQFRKAVMKDRDKSKENLGAIMSGRASVEEDDIEMADDEMTEPMSLGQGQNLDKTNNGNGNSNSADKSNNGKSEDKKGNGKEKNKDKGNGKGKDK
ncbi:MAG: hypothetical protein PVJ21_04065 [Anaerolineales bacterium]|jgi:hypothetical protein